MGKELSIPLKVNLVLDHQTSTVEGKNKVCGVNERDLNTTDELKIYNIIQDVLL